MVQRFLAAKSKKSAQVALLLNIPLIFLIMTLGFFTGLVLYANFFYCDPISNKDITSSNQLIGHFVVKNMYMIPGMSGFFLASLFCGSLSSLSSVLNSQVSIIWNDCLKPINYFKKFNDKQSLILTKLLVVICGIIDTGFAFLIATYGENLSQISSSLNGSFVAPTIGLFLLSAFFKMTNSIGAISGNVAGFAAGCWISIGSYYKKPKYQQLSRLKEYCYNNMTSNDIYENYYKEKILVENKINGSYFGSSSRASNLEGFDVFYSLSYQWYCTFGVIVTLVVGLLVSLIANIFSKNKNEVNDDHIIFDFGQIFSVIHKKIFKRRKLNQIDTAEKRNAENSNVLINDNHNL